MNAAEKAWMEHFKKNVNGDNQELSAYIIERDKAHFIAGWESSRKAMLEAGGPHAKTFQR